MFPGPLNVLYEDNHCLVVAKPAGVLVIGDETGDATLADQARSYLKEKYRKPGDVFLGIVHRIDRPVSGIVLFARTSKAAARLSEQFRSGTVEKTYRAIVEGTLAPRSGTLVDWLAKDEATNTSRVVPPNAPGGRRCELLYETLRTGESNRRSLVDIALKTGRSHQIRVQLAHRGCPIVGDVKYGGPPFAPGRIALHATRLVFEHPTRREPVEIVLPAPESWPGHLEM